VDQHNGDPHKEVQNVIELHFVMGENWLLEAGELWVGDFGRHGLEPLTLAAA